jgi:integrase
MQHFGSFRTKRDAVDFYDRARLIRREQRLQPGQPINLEYTVAEMFQAYLPQAEHRRAFREQRRFAHWWMAYWPRKRVFDLTPPDIEQARIALRKSGRFNQRRESTVDHYLKTLKHAMRAMIQPRAWVVDLWSQIPFEHHDSAPRIPLTPEQERALHEALSPDDIAKVRLATITGLRRGQLFRQRWEYIDWTRHGMMIPHFKRQRTRILPIPHEAMTILEHRWHAAGKPAKGWIFPKTGDQDLPEDEASWYKYRFRPALRRAGLDGRGITFHSMRHTFATRFLEAGGNVRALQKAGGWSSLTQVEIYTQLFDETVRAGMEQGARIGAQHSTKLQKHKQVRSREKT